MNLGSLIRRYRKERKLTLRAVAEKAGISEGFLSQVENDVNSPSVDTLSKICNAIGVKAGDLLNQASKQEELVLIQKSEWDDFDLPHTGFMTRRFFSPENRKVIDSAVLVIEPGKSIPVRKNIKNGQEVLCILKGSLELVHGERAIHLADGDTVHYFAEPKKQSITNKNKDLAIALWIGTV
ncbi:MAG TPA: helix-turn-helix domain-containing protein [Desulfatiglandales bacterium]|nr:helix-turn-helix domain-containing protein [Desulfatiglandales bacterium]